MSNTQELREAELRGMETILKEAEIDGRIDEIAMMLNPVNKHMRLAQSHGIKIGYLKERLALLQSLQATKPEKGTEQ